MSYEDDFDGLETITLTNPEYWVQVKTCLSRGEKKQAEGALTRATIGISEDGAEGARMTPSITEYRDLMVLNSISSWNLAGKDGVLWPIDVEHVNKLKDADFALVYARVDKLNSPPTAAEAQRFPQPS